MPAGLVGPGDVLGQLRVRPLQRGRLTVLLSACRHICRFLLRSGRLAALGRVGSRDLSPGLCCLLPLFTVSLVPPKS